MFQRARVSSASACVHFANVLLAQRDKFVIMFAIYHTELAVICFGKF